ncbi:MAG TPA: hypothetical protein VIK27_06420 [Candidatus Aquilonibacter sp.]
MKKQRKAFFVVTSLLFATAFLGVAVQANPGAANATSVVTHPQQMESPSPSPSPT